MKQRYILIHGPTGVGKSATIDSIGESLSIEVVNCDVGQFYQALSIGTAKPDWQNAAVPHHLFDIIQQPQDFSVVEYRDLIKAKIEEIWQRGNTPVLVGGSGFYGKSLFFPPSVDGEEKESCIQDNAWELLHALDPVRAKNIHKNDGYRLGRALSILRSTGKSPSSYVPEFNPLPGDCLVLFLTRERQELYARINARTYEMFNEGWIQEVQKLKSTPWENFLERKKLIGYTDILGYIKEGHCDDDDALQQLITIIQQRTRNYAKRQETFWKTYRKALEPYFKESGSMVAQIDLSSDVQGVLVKDSLAQFLKG